MASEKGGAAGGEFSRAEMIAIAKAQQGVLLVLLGNLGVAAVRIALRSDSMGAVGFLVILPLAMFFTYRLATGLREARPLLPTVALCLPVVNIIVLFVLSGKATKVIRAHGHEVGLLGADVAKMEADGDSE